MHLREHPHCMNCEHLQKKRKGYHCRTWKADVHPEQAGHMKERISNTVSVYEITCSHYHPKKHIKA